MARAEHDMLTLKGCPDDMICAILVSRVEEAGAADASIANYAVGYCGLFLR
jgi:hypothetical protein